MKPTITSSKYNNCRLIVLIIFIASVVNFGLFFATDVFFVFSAYIPILLTTIGRLTTVMTGVSLYTVLFVIFAVATLVPYLLAFIFSKKHYGWMIAALALFSVDTLILFIDTIPVISVWEFSNYANVAFHVFLVVMLAMGVKYGIDYKKEQNQDTGELSQSLDIKAETNIETSVGTVRKMTILRKKSFVGCMVGMDVYVNGNPVYKIKNGQSIVIEVPSDSFTLTASFSTGFAAGELFIEKGMEDINVVASVKMGMMTNYIVLNEI